MLMIIISLAVGVAVGALIPLSDKHKSTNSKLQHAGVVGLLFLMGISIGLNRGLLRQLPLIGFTSLVYGLLTTFFSIAVVALITIFFFGKYRDS